MFLQNVVLPAIMRFASTEIGTTSKRAVAITFPKPAKHFFKVLKLSYKLKIDYTANRFFF